MHPPTPHARRAAALRYQAEQLLRDAAAWDCEVLILRGPDGRPTPTVLRADVAPAPGPVRYPETICVGPARCPHAAAEPGPLPEPCRMCGGRDPLPF